jgi:4-hydroxythreonine-4-phosphate dehydrogenase
MNALSPGRPGPPSVAITLGDPRGIGPEVTRKALAHPDVAGLARFVVIGPEPGFAGAEAISVGTWRGEGSEADAGRLAGLAIERAVELAVGGEVDAIVTAPLDKGALHAAGWRFPGHTEMLKELTGAPAVAMMMASEASRLGGALRVVLATTHLPLRQVPAVLTARLLVEQTVLTAGALRRWWGLPDPRIALCAFNPHASDGGLFGDEEERIYGPALAALEDEALSATGPVPADTVFTRALAGEFDAVIAPYHDVGMAAFKTACFGTGVNVTLGLPFPRTSPDHGTALDIAGRDAADPSSMIEAIRVAVRLAGARSGDAEFTILDPRISNLES